MNKLKAFLLLASVCTVTSAHAKTYIVPFDQVKWRAVSEVDYCEVHVSDEHTNLEIVFQLKPPKAMKLLVKQPVRAVFGSGTVASVAAPSWARSDYSYNTKFIKMVPSRPGKNMLVTEARGADVILAEMFKGNWLNIRDAVNDVYFPTVHFGPVIEAFSECEQQLPPVSFEAVQNLTLHYNSGVITPNAQQRKQISDVSKLILKDQRIKKILIEGHTDSVGDSITNLNVSKRRASEVERWFSKNGVPKNKMEIKGHGQRYPVSHNKTREGRDLNRRVEIRLIRK
ncbi:OmpA family protein [Vibrio sp. B1FLJ16]|uniref:OmpA family protein n=1 Tax=Vibrio sp. B1FLJ16 TaxID=2751178 RepID=UPI0015F6E577|nr:OmpA family protein [Vibrio sp. B1FLJ16]CAD7811950.1 Belongs to the ompA family [Vibrio sp. B1FLJ16]CAE6917614.1 Belongs to the ompA family [Vibrio sp. B1FLJ16]